LNSHISARLKCSKTENMWLTYALSRYQRHNELSRYQRRIETTN